MIAVWTKGTTGRIPMTMYVTLILFLPPLLNQLMTIGEDAKSVQVTGAKKELTYLNQFGPPRAPYQRFQRAYYNY
jgi:hypothetical protein